MAGIPRELLRWLQSLDLSSNIRNPKRDLSNGYLLAEMAARYWPSVELHQVDSGCSSVPRKQLNWKALQKMFRANGFHVSSDLIDGVVNCRDGAAMAVLEALYTKLTTRTLQVVPPLSDAPALSSAPTFQKTVADPTAHTYAPPPPPTTELPPEEKKEKEPEKKKAELPADYKAPTAQKSRPQQVNQAIRAPPEEKSEHDEHESSVQFDKVKIRQMPPNLYRRTVLDLDPEADAVLTPPEAYFSSAKSLFGLLSNLIDMALQDVNEALWARTEECGPAKEFSCNVAALPVAVRTAIWNGLLAHADDIGRWLSYRPFEGGALAEFFAHLWEEAVAPCYADSYNFDSDRACAVLICIGDAMVKYNPILAVNVAGSHLLPVMFNGLASTKPNARRKFVDVLLAFVDHAKPMYLKHLVADLHEAFFGFNNTSSTDDDTSGFYLTLEALCFPPSGSVSPEAVDLAQYHSSAAVCNANPVARMAGLSLLTHLCHFGGIRYATKHIAFVAHAAADTTSHWELQAQAIKTVAALLTSLQASGAADGDSMNGLYDACAAALQSPRLFIQLVALRELAKPLKYDVTPEHLRDVYVATLRAVPEAYRATLFSTPSGSQRGENSVLPSVFFIGQYRIDNVPNVWDPLSVVAALAKVALVPSAGVTRNPSKLTSSSSSPTQAAGPSLTYDSDVLRLLNMTIVGATIPSDSVTSWWDAMKVMTPALLSALAARDAQVDEEIETVVGEIVRKLYEDVSGVTHSALDDAHVMESKAVDWLRNVVATS